MSLSLFPHNQKAYEAALHMMEREGKAAVVHPTGTGKSFIAFKLAEEHPESSILWMAPSGYIFQTQLENLRRFYKEPDGAALFWNITFLTYAKLMMDEGTIGSLQPDYIILDEFHRCGASGWGKSVQKLLSEYPGAKVLGLSATNIRYLDSQRDMAEEIFGGHIASEMTLGEAIVREILPAPKYVISLYSYQEEFKKLKKRVSSINNTGVRAADEEILERLKRALEHADGLDEIFARHMEKKDGKYIVFCADKEHMAEMAGRAEEWFCRVDSEPHIYTVYYGSPETDREFSAFKKDRSSHLKLLYCIDMLNEGVHVEDIDGVILLRPTVSPTLYLQQVGRCLAAGKTRHPVIFDIVNNFDSLYSIDSLQKEIGEALALSGCTEMERQEFEERFRIIDEAKDCRILFGQLRRNLSASWDIYYLAAEAYYKRNGNLKIPKSYATESGLALGVWLLAQKRMRAGKIPGSLTDEQIEKLNRIGMEWERKSEQSFARGYEALAAYQREHGNADVKAGFVTEDGFKLGKWVSSIRQKRKGMAPSAECPEGSGPAPEHSTAGMLTEEQIQELDALGMVWDKHGMQWEKNFRAAEAYYRLNGNLDIPRNYKTCDGVSLGVWLENQRSIYAGKKSGAAALTRQQIGKLDSIGMVWEKKYASLWEERMALAKRFYEEHGHLDIPSCYSVDGVELGKWIYSLRLKRMDPSSSGRKLTEERIRELDGIGMVWNKDAWEDRYQLAADYYRKHGNLRIPSNFVTNDRVWLGKWVYEQKKNCRNRTLSEERRCRLEKIGMEWGTGRPGK